MPATNILDLPVEAFYYGIFKHLCDIEIYKLRKAGNRKLKELSEAYVQLGICLRTYLRLNLIHYAIRLFVRVDWIPIIIL